MPAPSEPDPYTVLGVAPTASDAEIRAAYRALVARYHPDLHQGNPLEGLASAKMAEINRAYELLSDPARRSAFDQQRGASPREWAAAASAFRPGFPPGTPSRRSAKVVFLVLALLLLLRFGPILLRLLTALFDELVEGAALLRGTPFVAAAVLLAVVILLLAWRRRRRSKARPGP
jgi:hypothetical protein